ICYGIAHDQVTARVSVEYFTIGHPPIFDTESPTLLALGWGIIATWWVGAMLSVPAVLTSRVGSWPKLSAADLRRPVLMLLAAMAVGSLAAGIAGYFAAEAGYVWLVEPLASEVPRDKQVRFLADLWAHNAAYGVGFVGGITICIWALVRRARLARHAIAS
ncbi:MAG: hypothetical protein AB7U73_20685, partial [Pirellulales bacterium]